VKILLARTAGFCFGVNKAINRVYRLLEEGSKDIYTLGPIIHNEQMIDELRQKGVNIISDVSRAPENSKVVIRTHGVTSEVYREMENRNIEVIDLTCPYVKKIHKLVSKMYVEGHTIVIAGDKNHPEVVGINGWCENSAYIAGNPEDIEGFPEFDGPCCLVAQTTITKEKFENIYNKLKEKCKNIKKFDTICNATITRQTEAEEIARIADVMLVVGSKNSSNTRKLFEICKKHCNNTYYIETYGDLPPINIKEIKTLGITAGASTPERIIKEVIEKMEELNKQENELSFQEAFESSLVTLRSGETVKGRIIGFNNAEIFVDLGYKSDGIIPIEEYTDDPDFKPEENIKIGEEVEVYVVRVNDGEGNVLLSKKKVDAKKSMELIKEAYENKTNLTGKVIETTNGGIVASVRGVRVFIPASQIAEKYVKDTSEYLKQPVSLRIIEFNPSRRKIIGSQRVVLAEQREQAENAFWSGIEVGKKYKGVVKNIMDFGAFVDIGGFDGLVHISEISWSKIKHPSEVLKVGQEVEVTVLDFDREKKRISLGLRRPEDNPWVKAAEKYKVGDIVKGKVVRLVPFGAFIELEEGIDGLVHISQISSVRIAKPGDVLKTGQEVEAKVVEVDIEAKKINLSIKEVNPIDPENKPQGKKSESTEKKAENKEASEPSWEDEKPEAKEAEEEIPNEHKEELKNTIGDIIGDKLQ